MLFLAFKEVAYSLILNGFRVSHVTSDSFTAAKDYVFYDVVLEPFGISVTCSNGEETMLSRVSDVVSWILYGDMRRCA